jgi:deazaflavin-dependent oxidoreductase (nitroreductase family)
MWFNPIMTWLLRSPLHGFISKNMMLMTYQGRKSGKTFTTPMNYARLHDKNGEYLLTTSTRERKWWRNLRGGAAVNLRLQGKEVQAKAEAVEDEQLVALDLSALVQGIPQYAHYLNIQLDAQGNPDPLTLAQAAKDRITIRTRLA